MTRTRRLPRKLEREVAKFLSTIGFSDYGAFLWQLSTETPPAPRPAPALLAPAISRHILDQSRHDPAVVAMGREAISHLRQIKRNLVDIWSVSSAELFDGESIPPSALFVVARLDDDACDRLTSMIEGLRSLGARSFMIVITEQIESDTAPDAAARFSGTRLVFWRDHYDGGSRSSARLFATFIHAVGASNVVSFRNQLGLETIGFYGCALATCHRLFARLEAPTDDADGRLEDIYFLRLTAPYATLLARSAAEADLLRAHSPGLGGPGVAVLSDDQARSHDALVAIFGTTFEDRRSATSRSVIATLLAPREQEPPRLDLPAGIAPEGEPIDVTVTIVFHRERELAAPALASLSDMVEMARRGGLRVEARAMLDRADDVTADLVRTQGAFLDDVRVVSFGDPAVTRNAATALARGRFLAFLDGDDLWGADWLLSSHRAATAPKAAACGVWHPEAYLLFHASDCARTSGAMDRPDSLQSFLCIQQSSRSPDFEPRDLLLESLWTANAFARREIYQRFPYRPNDWSRQIGIEDWRWNLETLGHGVEHLIVPDTVHMIRVKEGGSLGHLHDAKGLLPLLP